MPLDPRLNSQSLPINPRFENGNGVKQLLFDFFNIRSQAPIQLPETKVQAGAISLLKIGKGQLAYLLIGKMADRIEKPTQITKNPCLITLERNNTLVSALLPSGRLIVG